MTQNPKDPEGQPQAESNTPEEQQPLIGFRTNEDWEDLLQYVNGLVSEMELIPDEITRSRVFDLLEGLDTLHREALTRLVYLFKEGVLEQVITDPAIHTLMELYDLLPQNADAGSAPAATNHTDVNDKGAPIPHWVPAMPLSTTLDDGQALQVDIEDDVILLCRAEGAYFALSAACAQDGALMSGGSLSGFTLACPHHEGCFYDIRQGTRMGASGQVPCFPTQIAEDGRVSIGMGMDFTPHLPSF